MHYGPVDVSVGVLDLQQQQQQQRWQWRRMAASTTAAELTRSLGPLWRNLARTVRVRVRLGELGDNLYVVESGSFNVFVNSKQVATRGKGTCFGQ